MKLFVKCRECNEYALLKKSVNDRAELARKIGDQFGLQCQNWLKNNSYHVNEV